MICPECGAQVRMVCAACRAKRQRIGILLHQRRFLEAWRGGSLQLRTREKNGAVHVELFDDRWHAYCGIDLFDVPPQPVLVRELPADLCGACRAILDEQLANIKEIRYALSSL
jgi:hypothetical protein